MEPQLHLAVLAFPFGTHAAPLHALAAGLASAAPHVAFSFLNSAASNAALAASTSAPPNLKHYDVDDGNSTGGRKSPPEELDLFLRVTPGNFREGMEKAVRGAGGAPISYVLSDCFIWFAGDLAAELAAGTPWAAFWTGSPHSFSAHLHDDLILETFENRDQGEATLDEDLAFLPGMEGLRFRDIPSGIVHGDRGSPIARLLRQMGRKISRADVVAINGFEGLDTALMADCSSKFKKWLPLGPLNLLLPPPAKPDASGCLKWLDSKPSGQVVYVGFGTLITPPAAEMRELAEGLEASGAPFLWSLKERFWELLPEGFLSRIASRGLVVEWVPQPQVLKHAAVGAFITHGGWNSVLESLAGGVPMICRPFLGDQMTNERCISHVWRIGAGFAGGMITRGEVAELVSTVLGTEEGKRMKERAVEISAMAHLQARPGGSSAENLQTLAKMVSGG